MHKKLRITYNAPVILTMVAISFLATLLNYITGGVLGQLLFMTYHSPLASPMTWLRAFTHIFGHVDWSHLIGNMSYLFFPTCSGIFYWAADLYGNCRTG